MDAGKYRFLLWQLIAAMDTGKYDHLRIDDVRLHARGETLSKFLQEQFGAVADFSIYSDQDWKSLNEEAASMENAIDARRKFGVNNRGVSLLMAWASQGVQNGTSAE
jgi:hypothetical protein